MESKIKNSVSANLKLCAITAALVSTFAMPAFAQTQSSTTPNVIGFFQSSDGDGNLERVWNFNGLTKDGKKEDLNSSGYTVLIDAFWVNYPYCWSNNPFKDQCKDLSNRPGLASDKGLDDAFWKDFASGAQTTAPNGDPETKNVHYINYWTSLHTSGPGLMSELRTKINSNGKKIKLLASIGGWNMGGSSNGQPYPDTLDKFQKPAWYYLLKNPKDFSDDMTKIVNLENSHKVKLYDGIDIDIETPYGEGCQTTTCTNDDKEKAINDMVKAILIFKESNPNALLSTSPRASDIYCKGCAGNNEDGVGFMGEILQQLADKNVYFDYINPQFYNDDISRNIPNNTTLGYGAEVPEMLKNMKKLNIIGPHTSFNIGLLAQTTLGKVDTGGASTNGNPGVPKSQVKFLWDVLNKDQNIQDSGIKLGGFMAWSANLDLAGTHIDGNIRSTTATDDAVPFNWGSDINTSITPPITTPYIDWSSNGLPASATLTKVSFNNDAVLKNEPDASDTLTYSCSDKTTPSASCLIDTINSNSFILSGANEGDVIIITAADSKGLFNKIESAEIKVNSHPILNVTIENKTTVGGYYYSTPGDSNMTPAGHPDVKLENINLSQGLIKVGSWNNPQQTTSCPLPNDGNLNVIYQIKDKSNGVECVLKGSSSPITPTQTTSVILINKTNVGGYYFRNGDGDFAAAGWQNIQLNKTPVQLKAWNNFYSTQPADIVPCPLPDPSQKTITYTITGDGSSIQCTNSGS